MKLFEINTPMKLFEIIEEQHEEDNRPIFAWLEPSRGPEDVSGVRLAYIQPIGPYYDLRIKAAEDDARPDRRNRMQSEKELYAKKGQKFFTPDFDWWMNEEDFHAGKDGFKGATKGRLLSKYPNIIIANSRQDAIDQAKKAKVI